MMRAEFSQSIKMVVLLLAMSLLCGGCTGQKQRRNRSFTAACPGGEKLSPARGRGTGRRIGSKDRRFRAVVCRKVARSVSSKREASMIEYSRRQLIEAVLGAAVIADAAPNGFLAGADCSHVGFFEARGKVYREAGVSIRSLPYSEARRHQLRAAAVIYRQRRVRKKKDSYNTINNLTYTAPLAVRVKRAGLKFLLDFHYSDTWADPGKQAKPAAWKELPFDQLERRMFEYNRDCIAALAKAGAMPDYVQIGNEITPGLLWPDGRVGGTFDTPEQLVKLGRLLKAAIHGIVDAAMDAPPKTVIHIDRGGNWKATQWFFDHLREQRVEFDIIGESYYPFWHGSLNDLQACLIGAAQRYEKPVIVAETAFPWECEKPRR